MLAAASPLPRDDTTPPVMKMYFGVRPSMVVFALRDRRRHQTAHLFQIRGGVHFERFVTCFHGLDADAVLERPQLLERFRPFEGGRLEVGQDHEGAPAI